MPTNYFEDYNEDYRAQEMLSWTLLKGIRVN